ncbi:hypothetical protein P152DRAFT_501343 [Eremomyces bilateralis CBS 781.70]|uniref:Uncharacterized protein n=1 Tax=Eremomyces bilateralis CBS 781.70 TaxID=1392243 RepID=A0A6G1G787_9PEZI|nr:uncharacterized protein P152DRAFT_501343 [Eremomyces bilateralis CBS 781.70]KAF1813801.1 hypothetical protein P152DRAFT_501343 [Eremomyces bilateralis CBS 781.70]
MTEHATDSESAPFSTQDPLPAAEASTDAIVMVNSPSNLDATMVRTVSSKGAVKLRHPAPDLQSLQGAYLHNVERLEESAERLSMSGSDLGEEIQKLHLEQKLSDSRRASLRSLQLEESNNSQIRSPEPSMSSHANSIVEVNTAARWGGYSPAGYIGSPIGSGRSSSWSHVSFPTTSKNRNRSASKGSKLGQVATEEQPEMEGQDETQPKDMPPKESPSQGHGPNVVGSPTSFALEYEQISRDIRDGFEDDSQLQPPVDGTPRAEYPPEHQNLKRPSSATSGDTFQQSRAFFEDFDGVHYAPSIREPTEQSKPDNGRTRHSSLLTPLPRPTSFAPPTDSMVYYPAPVPKLLNLPTRLSQAPSATLQAKRRTQMVDSLHPDARKSAVWLNANDVPAVDDGHVDPPRPVERRSMMTLNLPPQLRASVYFDTSPTSHEVAIKDGSAAATLDSILEASATAPVNAFTNHPFVGEIGGEVYKNQTKRKSAMPVMGAEKRKSALPVMSAEKRKTAVPVMSEKKEEVRKRHSRNVLRRKSASSIDLLTTVAEDPSKNSLDKHAADGRSVRSEDGAIAARHPSEYLTDNQLDAGEAEQDVLDADDIEYEEEDPYEAYGPPTTLLAELQLRKLQLKSRSRTAANAFPNGMHATLLELDAVAQIEKTKRRGQRVALAWQDPGVSAQDDQDDNEEVPLGMLFPGRNGLLQKKNMGNMNDWDRPLGLLAMKELEESEPLSKRRNRLLGIQRTPSPQRFEPPLDGAVEDDVGEEEGFEGETLAQRRRRLMDKEELDKALGDLPSRPVSAMFTSELMSTWGMDEDEKKKAEEQPIDKRASALTASPMAEKAEHQADRVEVEPENETLGQRRARLQRTGATQSTLGVPQRSSTMFLPTDSPNLPPYDANPPIPAPPVVRNRLSMADLLAAAPAGKHDSRRVSTHALVSALPPTSLLGQHEQNQARHRAELQERNRASGMGGPGAGFPRGQPAQWGAPSGGFMGGMFNDGSGGVGGGAGMSGGVQRMASMQNMPYLGAGNAAYPPMGMGGAMNGGVNRQTSMGMPHGGVNGWNQSMPMLGMPMNGMPVNGMPVNGMPMNGMAMPMGQPGFDYMNTMAAMQMQDPPMDPRQRELIDRWRQSVAP